MTEHDTPGADVVKLVDEYERSLRNVDRSFASEYRDPLLAVERCDTARAALLDAFAAQADQYVDAVEQVHKYASRAWAAEESLAAKDAEIERLTGERDGYQRRYFAAMNGRQEWRHAAEQAEADLARLRAARVPDSCQLVPKEPTEAMLNAHLGLNKSRIPEEMYESRRDLRPLIYKAMLAAAPIHASEAAPAQVSPGDALRGALERLWNLVESDEGLIDPRQQASVLDELADLRAVLNQTGEA